MEEIKDFDPKDVEDNKIIASLSYIWILFLIPLIAKKDSKFAVEHAKQGLVLFIVEIVAWLFIFIPFVGWVLGTILGVILFVVALIGFIYAIQGRFWKIPLVYDLAKGFNF